jgi:glycosyltransferase involved in cell wall biosynthesis
MGLLTNCEFATGGGGLDAPPPRGLRPERVVLLSDFEPISWTLERRLGGVPPVVVLPRPPANPIPGVTYFTWEPGRNPIYWDDRIEGHVRAGLDTVAFLMGQPTVGGRTLAYFHQLGVRRVALLDAERTMITAPWRHALWRLLERGWGGRSGRGRRAEEPPPSEEAAKARRCRDVLAHAAARHVPARGGRLRIAHFVPSLNSGGAERQVCYAARLQRERGHDTRILTYLPLEGEHGHYRFLLNQEGVPVRCVTQRWLEAVTAVCRRLGPRGLAAFRHLPEWLVESTFALCGTLLLDPVDVLHCYVDTCNCIGLLAGALAGVPGVVLSFRNGHPGHFPNLLEPWMRPCYQAGLGWPGVVLSSNSQAGARDYELWLGLQTNSVPVVRNAFMPTPPPEPDARARWRRELGIAPEAPVVVGVFRLDTEKRPLFFLECVARLRQRVAGLRVVMAGVGVLLGAVRRRLAELALEGTVVMLGQRREVPLILAGGDVLLLTSDWEGTPNVLLEAQHCGCVPVATQAGGSGEALLPGVTGELVVQDDQDGVVEAVSRLLADPQRRRRMAAAGRAFVAERFPARSLAEGNESLYRQALGHGAPPVLAGRRPEAAARAA